MWRCSQWRNARCVLFSVVANKSGNYLMHRRPVSVWKLYREEALIVGIRPKAFRSGVVHSQLHDGVLERVWDLKCALRS